MRRRFTTSNAAEFQLHDHVAWSGTGHEALSRLAVSAFSAAAPRGEKMLLVAEHPEPGHLDGLDDAEELIRRGALELASVEDTYAHMLDPVAQRAAIERLVDQALDEGYTGMCIVAENSRLACGSDEEFEAWLAWESTVERMEAIKPLIGICFFDRQVVPRQRLADLAAIHPVLSVGFDTPVFQLFFDGDAVRVAGEMDALCADQLHRILANAPVADKPLLDVSDVSFMDHRALLTLNQVARQHNGFRVRNAKPLVQRVWQLLDLSNPALEFC